MRAMTPALMRAMMLALMLTSLPAGAKAAAEPGAPARATAAKGARAARPSRPRSTIVELYHVNRHETMQLRLRDEQGRSVRGVQKRFDRFLRCHHTNQQHAMNPRLVTLLYKTGRHWPGHRVEVVSGYRAPNVAKNPRSPHMKGLACDFRVVGIANTQLRDYLRRAYQKVGVGYYPNSSFVHLDVRKDRSAFWIDYSGPGERAVYSENPNLDLRSGKADKYRPTKIDEDWLNEMPPPDKDDAPPPLITTDPPAGARAE
jgi:uncharacterized protein YcbK (DUF882 family)